ALSPDCSLPIRVRAFRMSGTGKRVKCPRCRATVSEFLADGHCANGKATAVVRDESRNLQARRPARTTGSPAHADFACDGVLRSPTPFACKGGVSCSSFAHCWPRCCVVRQFLRPISEYQYKAPPATGFPACRSACFASATTAELEYKPRLATAARSSPICPTGNIEPWCSRLDLPSSRCKLLSRRRKPSACN